MWVTAAGNVARVTNEPAVDRPRQWVMDHVAEAVNVDADTFDGDAAAITGTGLPREDPAFPRISLPHLRPESLSRAWPLPGSVSLHLAVMRLTEGPHVDVLLTFIYGTCTVLHVDRSLQRLTGGVSASSLASLPILRRLGDIAGLRDHYQR